MYSTICRWLGVAAACVFFGACSTSPTSPSGVSPGPALSQGPLVGLIPQGPPPVPDRFAGPMPNALGATSFLAFGDSITYGTRSSFDGSFLYDVPSWSYPVQLKLMLDQYHPGQTGAPRTYTVVNAGVPGEWASNAPFVIGGESRIQSEITANRPQGLLLLEGINDLANERTIDQTVAALSRIINTARANNVTVLVATMFQTYETCPTPDTCRDNEKDQIAAFNDAIRAMAANRQNVHVVDLYASFGTNHAYVGADGLHPNEAGYARMASTFLAAIEARFGIRSSFQ